MAVTPLAPVLSAPRPASRVKTAAFWLFVLPLFIEGVAPNAVKIRLVGLAMFAFATIASGRRLPLLAAERTNLTFVVLALIVIVYLAFGSWPAGGAAVTANSTSGSSGAQSAAWHYSEQCSPLAAGRRRLVVRETAPRAPPRAAPPAQRRRPGVPSWAATGSSGAASGGITSAKVPGKGDAAAFTYRGRPPTPERQGLRTLQIPQQEHCQQ